MMKIKKNCPVIRSIKNFSEPLFNSFSQIMLQENALTGFLFLAGLYVGHWYFGLAALLAVVSGVLTAVLLRFPKAEIKAGLYGFSAALTGVALLVLFEARPFLWLLVIIGGVLSSLLQRLFIVLKIPAFTFPFIVVSWFLVLFIRNFTDIMPSSAVAGMSENGLLDWLLTSTNGFGQVIFQGSALPGTMFFVAVFFNNPVAALFGLAASSLGAAISLGLGQELNVVQTGLFGFNAVLTAIVFSGQTRKNVAQAFVGVILTIALHHLFLQCNFFEGVGGVFTFPFVVATWLMLWMIHLAGRIGKIKSLK